MTDDDVPSTGRRRVLGSLAAGAGGIAAGFAGALALTPKAVAVIQRTDRPRFAGKAVLITGATSGIGRAAAVAFAAEGGRVVFCGRRENLGREVQDQIRASGGDATYIRADVRREGDVKALVGQTISLCGRIDAALNNAGITLEKPLHEFSLEEWDDIVNTNLRGVFLAMKYEIPHMIAAGGGNIVVTSSSNAIATSAKRSIYAATKHGLTGLVQAAALDYGQYGIRVNALVPGTTDTALIRRVAGMESMPDAMWEMGAAQYANTHVSGLHRLAKPEEIAAAALTLASSDHPFMTGASFVIDGGATAHGGG
jgi:NAD(P)-dependent dehydrogenase (short-subunit alcohol dehydrogenase family)